MSTTAESLTNVRVSARRTPLTAHHMRVAALVLSVFLVVLWFAARGMDYYRLPLTERPFHPLHNELRPAGFMGVRLGMLSGVAFLCLFLYPLRKKWAWLRSKGKTKNWLDMHIVLGLSVPLLVTLHSSFKLRGLAGIAYWIMMAIVFSGIAGRYLYAQIPRKMTEAELSLAELEQLAQDSGAELQQQNLLSEKDWRDVLAVPSRDEVDRMPLWSALLAMVLQDIRRPFRVALLRRRALAGHPGILTLGGLFPSRHRELERVIGMARRQSWLTAKIVFMGRASEVFRLWHVVHRPFSYSFAILTTAHVTLVILMGYF
jgi:hypothetical protein